MNRAALCTHTHRVTSGASWNNGETTTKAVRVLVITHAVQLVPMAHPEGIRHVTRVHGVTQAWAIQPAESDKSESQEPAPPPSLSSGEHKPAGALDEMKRVDKWSRSLQWPTLLFSTVVLLVEGDAEGAAVPLWHDQVYNEPLSSEGVRERPFLDRRRRAVSYGICPSRHSPCGQCFSKRTW